MEQFFNELQQPLFRYLLRLSGCRETADDLTQETCIRGWTNQTQLQQATSPKAWLFRVAHNVWIDSVRRQNSRPIANALGQHQPASPSSGPDLIASANELGARVWAAIDQLPERQRQVMHLRVIEQLEISEIAEVLEIDPAAVRSNLAVARKRLRTEFQSYFHCNQ